MGALEGHIAVAGLGFGDETKGATVDWLCRRDGDRPVAVVRLGGHQAAHNVVTEDGRHHTFAQFGSGTLAGVPTFLSRFMAVEPLSLVAEADHLMRVGVARPYNSLMIDGSCLVVTPYHWKGNIASVSNIANGTCGKGHGEAIRLSLEHPEEVLRYRDLGNYKTVMDILALQRNRFRLDYGGPVVDNHGHDDLASTYGLISQKVPYTDSEHLNEIMARGSVIFEMSQGVLLDEWKGFHPHTTWSTTTFENVDKLVEDLGVSPLDVYRLGVLRTYTTRHGPGPFPTERVFPDPLPEPHNNAKGWQGKFRVGYFDSVLHRYAIEACGRVDGIALSHLDQAHRSRMCLRYAEMWDIGVRPEHDLRYQERLGRRLQRVEPVYEDLAVGPARIEEALGVPVVITADGPTSEHRIELARMSS